MRPLMPALILLLFVMAACSQPGQRPDLQAHLPGGQADHAPPPAAAQAAAVPETRPVPPFSLSAETYSVTVRDVPVRDLLFVLARDARLDIDIAPQVGGTVTLNAHQRPLPELLERIARQVPLRYEYLANSLLVTPDSPYLQHYPVDYVNLGRSVTTSVSNNMQIGTGQGGGQGSDRAADNLSATRIENTTQHRFWEKLEKSIAHLLQEGSAGKTAPPGEPQRLAVHPEAGFVSVFATQAQQRQVARLIAQMSGAVRRQVLIEASIVEVSLNEGHEQGIDWTSLVSGGVFEFVGNTLKNGVNLRYSRSSGEGDNPRALLNLLQRFGTGKVLSSPRLSVLNNQTALLKVVENYVYFSVKADTTSTANVGSTVTYTTTPQTVAVGLVMGVTPQIAADDSVILNIRPTITSISREVPDPNPELRKNGIENLVPMIRTREIESVMRVANGQIAVLGGLMEDRADYQTARLPGLGQVPLAGEVFTNRNNRTQKTELVIFLRPVVVREPALSGAYAPYARYLPDAVFLDAPQHARPFALPSGAAPQEVLP